MICRTSTGKEWATESAGKARIGGAVQRLGTDDFWVGYFGSAVEFVLLLDFDHFKDCPFGLITFREQIPQIVQHH